MDNENKKEKKEEKEKCDSSSDSVVFVAAFPYVSGK